MSWDSPKWQRPPMPYAPIEPYDSGHLDVGEGHRIYWETFGNPAGIPALFIHGGPGGGCSREVRRFFDPERYRIVLFDQRGCGRSQPLGCVEANTTRHLVGDMEMLRVALGIDRWLLFGGSWGVTLALAYGLAHPGRVSAMVLRGVFLARRSELRWLYADGASWLYPEAWERFLAPIADRGRSDLVRAYHDRLHHGSAEEAYAAAAAWCAWEDALVSRSAEPVAAGDDAQSLARARIETHYFVNGAFLGENELLGGAHRLRSIPGVIVHGRHDAVTPPASAWALHRAWAGSRLDMAEDAGHASAEPGILRRLIEATDGFARQLETAKGEVS